MTDTDYKRYGSVVCAAILCLLWPAMAGAWPAQVMRVHDGDTVLVAPTYDTTSPMRLRLYGIDAPELRQPGGKASKAALKTLLPAGAAIEVIPRGEGKYGRSVALISHDGRIVNGLMVESGHAWVYAKYCRDALCRQWNRAQKEAARQRLGLWAGEKPVAPWQWRKGHGS